MEELIYVHPILKKLFSKQKVPKCTLAGRIKEFLPVWKLLTKDQALAFSRRLPNSFSNGTITGEGSKSTKVKSGTTKASRSGSEDNAGKGLHFNSLSVKNF